MNFGSIYKLKIELCKLIMKTELSRRNLNTIRTLIFNISGEYVSYKPKMINKINCTHLPCI